MTTEGIKDKVSEKARRIKYDIEDMSLRDKAIIGGLVSAFAFIIAIFAVAAYRKDDKMTHEGSIIDPILPRNDNFNTPPVQTPFDFGWVDGNDKSGLQRIELDVKYYDGNILRRVREQQLTWEQGIEKTFYVTGRLLDTATNKGLKGWGWKAHVFDTEAGDLGDLTLDGTSEYGGYINFNFKLKPKNAGVYRVRVAAGDAANEEPIVFNLPANTPTTQSLLG